MLTAEWHKRLPPRYWDTLGELRTEEARHGPSVDRIKTELTEMEAEAGLRISTNKTENFRTRKTLIHLKQVLSATELFLSFHLGKTASYVWAVTPQSLAMYRLAPEGEIRAAILAFRDAVRDARPESAQLGEQLYRQLFGKLGPRETSQRDWLLSVDGALFEAPLAALVSERKGVLTYLIEQHSLRIVPGAWSLAGGLNRPAGGWLGVGDPIYNSADARWRVQHRYVGWLATAGQLTRLPASADELRSSARSWGAGTMLLEGAGATLENFQNAAARGPAVIHLATHVLSKGDTALIAFGADRTGQPQFLSTADVAMMRVPGAVVAMTGCATGAGELRDGAGLLGLTRAWQMAGARAVVATLWPVADSRGEIFSSFYRHLQNSTPAEALRQSQIEMIHSRTWRAAPSSWASYVLSGGSK